MAGAIAYLVFISVIINITTAATAFPCSHWHCRTSRPTTAILSLSHPLKTSTGSRIGICSYLRGVRGGGRGVTWAVYTWVTSPALCVLDMHIVVCILHTYKKAS